MKALAIDCPNGCAPTGTFCNGHGVGLDICQARINRARAITLAKRKGCELPPLDAVTEEDLEAWREACTKRADRIGAPFHERTLWRGRETDAQIALGRLRPFKGGTRQDSRKRVVEAIRAYRRTLALDA